jgi:hypothetical protein
VDTPWVQVYRWMLAESLILLNIFLLYIMRDVHGLLEESDDGLVHPFSQNFGNASTASAKSL